MRCHPSSDCWRMLARTQFLSSQTEEKSVLSGITDYWLIDWTAFSTSSPVAGERVSDHCICFVAPCHCPTWLIRANCYFGKKCMWVTMSLCILHRVVTQNSCCNHRHSQFFVVACSSYRRRVVDVTRSSLKLSNTQCRHSLV